MNDHDINYRSITFLHAFVAFYEPSKNFALCIKNCSNLNCLLRRKLTLSKEMKKTEIVKIKNIR